MRGCGGKTLVLKLREDDKFLSENGRIFVKTKEPVEKIINYLARVYVESFRAEGLCHVMPTFRTIFYYHDPENNVNYIDMAWVFKTSIPPAVKVRIRGRLIRNLPKYNSALNSIIKD